MLFCIFYQLKLELFKDSIYAFGVTPVYFPNTRIKLFALLNPTIRLTSAILIPGFAAAILWLFQFGSGLDSL